MAISDRDVYSSGIMATGASGPSAGLPAEHERTLQQCVRTVRNLFPVDLKSIVLFGSAARGYFHPKRSELHLLLVLEEVQFEHVARLTPYVSDWRKLRVVSPLLLDRSYMSGALDTYPIELLEMSIKRRILWGEDPFERLIPSNESVRRQCERELKGTLLMLQRVLLEAGTEPKILLQTLRKSGGMLVRVCRYLVWLGHQELQVDGDLVISELEKAVGFHLDAVRKAWEYRLERIDPTKREAAPLFRSYMLEVQKLARFVDSLTPSAPKKR
ncbi:MAG: hypothetical protein HYT87_04915 [Nitrospirae bacterium]|nr:hypothetical protein [Nitrospirota bacterium]